MTKFILRWTINSIALFLAVSFVPGVNLQGSWTSILWLALIFGLINAFPAPAAEAADLPAYLSDPGFIHHADQHLPVLAYRPGGQAFGVGFTIESFWAALLGGLVVTVVSVVLSLILKDELKKHRKVDKVDGQQNACHFASLPSISCFNMKSGVFYLYLPIPLNYINS